MLLKLLKTFHRKMDSALAEEIAGLRARLQNRQDFDTEMGKMDNFVRLTRDRCEAKKEKKIKRLLTEGGTKKKRCCRNRKKYR